MTAAAAPPARARPVAFRLGAALLLIHVALAVLGPWIAPYAQDQMMTGRRPTRSAM